MTDAAQDVLDQALKLSAKERALLARNLLASLSEEVSEDEADRAWGEESVGGLPALKPEKLKPFPGKRCESASARSLALEACLLRPGSGREIREAGLYYRAEDDGLAVRFILAVDDALERLREAPEAQSPHPHRAEARG